MSSSTQTQQSSPPRSRRLKIGVACQSCRSKKVKCDGNRPACSNCRKRTRLQGICTYGSSSNDAPSPRVRARRNPLSSSLERPDELEVRAMDRGGAPRVFAGEVETALDAKLGLPSNKWPSLVPMIDAPLFGVLALRSVTVSSAHHLDMVLPPRNHADHLVEVYWQYIQPLEPFLEQEHFSHSYQALFAGNPLNDDERIFISTLNAVFALSTQFDESIKSEQRREASNIYFHRAWSLLRPEAIIWEPGSLGLVQCLLLMTQYLQCTNNPHQTWMAVGSAVRIAQSLGLHIPDVTSSGVSSREGQRRRQLWQGCVFLDRQISWVLGRTSMVHLTASSISSAVIDPLHDAGLEEENRRPPSSHYSMKILDLNEIIHHIMLSQASTCSVFAPRFGLPRLHQNDDHFSRALQYDISLNKWEKSLHQSFRTGVRQGNPEDISYKQGVILRLKLLHARILLFRPMLARFCFAQPQAVTGTALDEGLEYRLLHDCASLCVDSAQKMIALVHEHHKTDGIISIIPWWYRVFYLHVAGLILIAATLRADLFTPILSNSWSEAISALHAHKHLSPFVQQYVTSFETLSCRISETQHSGGGQPRLLDGASNTYFQDIFQDMGLDPNIFLFNKEDMSWLSGFESIL